MIGNGCKVYSLVAMVVCWWGWGLWYGVGKEIELILHNYLSLILCDSMFVWLLILDISEQNMYFFCFPKQKKIFDFVSASKNLSVIVFPSKRKDLVVFSNKRKF